ncbi:hypothetical protein [Flagellimonas sp. S3867]|uniref:hypothetical protein n=1 Tax=Flagellimonas sp. S3867 TaxID=2768063 RepID=UPI0016876A37|nr:hypothetical protein [Flagellimonas sp. S3867]
MHLLTIIWTLICAAIIIGYPMYLINKSYTEHTTIKNQHSLLSSDTIELLSYDMSKQSPGWSFILDVPQITEETLHHYPILFYLETEETCLKLPLNNGTLGYVANVYKNVGRVYITFKSLLDSVSNYHVPPRHLINLKILIIKSKHKNTFNNDVGKSGKLMVYETLQRAGVNINNYNDVLTYFSNLAPIEFKGHFKPSASTGKSPTRLTTISTSNLGVKSA